MKFKKTAIGVTLLLIIIFLSQYKKQDVFTLSCFSAVLCRTIFHALFCQGTMPAIFCIKSNMRHFAPTLVSYIIQLADCMA